MKFAILTSQFNPEVTHGLKRGAHTYLHEKKIARDAIEEFTAPGAFEIPLIAQKLAKTGKFAGVICLGCVIKGDTAHFEYISLAATMGIMQATLATETPITFGILTTYTGEQAEIRSRDNAENKGREAAAACFETVETLKSLQHL